MELSVISNIYTRRHVMHGPSHIVLVGCQRCGLASLTSKNDVKHVSMNRQIFQQSFIITNLPFYLIWHEIVVCLVTTSQVCDR